MNLVPVEKSLNPTNAALAVLPWANDTINIITAPMTRLSKNYLMSSGKKNLIHRKLITEINGKNASLGGLINS